LIIALESRVATLKDVTLLTELFGCWTAAGTGGIGGATTTTAGITARGEI
jgi:hypothetical protein